jgi:hypothetical protein
MRLVIFEMITLFGLVAAFAIKNGALVFPYVILSLVGIAMTRPTADSLNPQQ